MRQKEQFDLTFILRGLIELPGFFINYALDRKNKNKDEIEKFDEVYQKYARLLMILVLMIMAGIFVIFILWMLTYFFSLIFVEFQTSSIIPIFYFANFGILFVISFGIYLESKWKLTKDRENKEEGESEIIKEIKIKSLDISITKKEYPSVYEWANGYNVSDLVKTLIRMNNVRGQDSNYLIDVANLETKMTGI